MATGGIVSRAAPGASLKLVPSIEGGTSGWCISEIVRSTAGDTSFSCGEPPISTGAIFAENCGGSASRSVLRVFVIAASYVPAVEIDGPPISTHANRSLPDGLRTAVVEIRSTSGEPVPGWRGGPCPRATPVDARGKPIVRSERPGPALEVQLPSAQSWKAHKEAGEACAPAPQCEDLPTQPPSGPCQLRLTEDLPFSAASGNVLTRLEIPRRVFAHALLSCVDVAYKQDTEDSQRFEGAPLTAAVLLDAAHPGSPPPSLPEMEPLAGDHRVFIAPSLVRHPSSTTHPSRMARCRRTLVSVRADETPGTVHADKTAQPSASAPSNDRTQATWQEVHSVSGTSSDRLVGKLGKVVFCSPCRSRTSRWIR